jgi:hypothetical protein
MHLRTAAPGDDAGSISSILQLFDDVADPVQLLAGGIHGFLKRFVVAGQIIKGEYQGLLKYGAFDHEYRGLLFLAGHNENFSSKLLQQRAAGPGIRQER